MIVFNFATFAPTIKKTINCYIYDIIGEKIDLKYDREGINCSLIWALNIILLEFEINFYWTNEIHY